MLRTIAGKEYKYPKVKDLVSRSLEEKGGRVILLLGQPGSGKSVFMSQLNDAFLEVKPFCLIPIRAEYLKKEDQPKDIFEVFAKSKEDKPKILILDSLDVLAYSRRRELQEWLFYVDKLKNLKSMTVICASRSFEAEHLYPMNKQEWSEKIDIELLPEDFVKSVFKEINYDYSTINPKLQAFLRTPLHLRISSEIISKGYDPEDINTLQGLYSKLCELLNISIQEMNILVTLARQMVNNRAVVLSYPLVGVALLDNISRMERPGLTAIIQVDSANKELCFSHQTLIDYFIAWDLINKDQSIIDFVLAYNQSLFIRPTIRHILGFLRATSEERLFKELNLLFFNKIVKLGFNQNIKIRTHIKTAIIVNMASWVKPTENEAAFLISLFNTSEDKDTLLLQFFSSFPNEEWYFVLKERYILPIIKNNKGDTLEYRTVISFLGSIAGRLPSEILDIATSLFDQGCSNTFEWFFRRISDEINNLKELDASLQEKYSNFLEQIVLKEFTRWYHEILVCCQRIAKYHPEKGLKLYFDSIRKESCDMNIKINSSQGSLTQAFDDILPAVYSKIPFQVLTMCSDYFENILSKKYDGDKKLLDYPNELLYADHSERFGIEVFFKWYKDRVLEFCKDHNNNTKDIINKLENSKKKTLRQLSMLCKIQQPEFYKNDILEYIKKIICSDLRDSSMYAENELYIRVLRKVFDVIEQEEAKRIINSILALQLEDKLQVRVWIWASLHNIPKNLHNKAIEERIEEIVKIYSLEKEYKYRPSISSSGFQSAKSIVPAEELRKMGLDELYELLTKNCNLKDNWDFENNIFYGGVEELAQTVARIFLEDINRYKAVIQKLANDKANDEYLLWFFYAFSDKDISSISIDWIIDLVNLVYTREKLEMSISRFLEKIADKISLDELAKLKDAISSLSESKDPEKDTFFESRSRGYGSDALGDGINRVRGSLPSLIIKLLSRFKEKWLEDILIKLSNDPTISVRAALVRYLPYAIKPLGWDRCYEIFSNAFQKGPEEYHELIPHFLQYTPKHKFNQVEPIINTMKEKCDTNLGEALASILTIFYLREMYSEEPLMSLLNSKHLLNKGKEESFHLLANEIRYEPLVDKCLKIINNLLEQEEAPGRCVSILFMQARIEDLKKISPVIEKIISKPKIRGGSLYYIFEYLEKCILVDPIEAFSLLEKIIQNVGEDFYNMRDFIPATHSKAPLNIINTVLECYPEMEDRAMKALDRLIEIRWDGVNEYLYAFDRL